MALHWMATQLLPALRERKLDPGRSPVGPGRLAALLGMLSRGEIHSGAAREVLLRMFESEEAPEAIVNAGALRQESDAGHLAALVDQVLSYHPAAVRDIRRGQGRAIGFLIGQVLQASGGRANPRVVRELLHQRLSSGDGPG
jgi:aspartyl-tRNA(Asn)/glutamyl-tRNA(Gln) amidotransferase subunit B